MKKFTDLKTFEQACELLNIDSKTVLPDFSNYPEQGRLAMIAHAKLPIIVRAANKLANDGEEVVFDFNDSSQCKYEPWFDMEDYSDGSGGFRFNGYDGWLATSLVGSRLCYISREVCEYTVNQFIEVYKAYFK